MFARYQPDLGDNDQYMDSLSKKLEAVEYVKKIQTEQVHRSRKIMAVVFVMGVVTGAIGIILALLHPTWAIQSISIPTLPAHNPILLPDIGFLLAVCLTGLGVIGLVVQRMVRNEPR